MDSDYDEYDEINLQPPYRQTKGNRYKPRRKKVLKYSTKPVRDWCRIQKCRFFRDDRHLFVGSYDCYWCGQCSCCWRKCDNCREPDEKEYEKISAWIDDYITDKYQMNYWRHLELYHMRSDYLQSWVNMNMNT